MNVPKRNAVELAEALRRRAALLSGEPWERTATAQMMQESADMIVILAARVRELEPFINVLDPEGHSVVMAMVRLHTLQDLEGRTCDTCREYEPIDAAYGGIRCAKWSVPCAEVGHACGAWKEKGGGNALR